MDDVDPCLDVRESVGGGQDGLAFELFMQIPMCPPIQGERGAVHKTSQVVVLVKVGDAVLHLIRVEVRLHICDLDECLQEERWFCFRTWFYCSVRYSE